MSLSRTCGEIYQNLMMLWIWYVFTRKSWVVRYQRNIYKIVHRERFLNNHRRRQSLSRATIFLSTWFWSNLKWLFQQRFHRLCLRFRFRRRLSFRFVDFRDYYCRFFEWTNRMNMLTRTSTFFLLDKQIIIIIMIMIIKIFDKHLSISKSFCEASADCLRSYFWVTSGRKKRWAVYVVYRS